MDASKADRHIAHYGTVQIERRKCPECNEMAFVIRGKMACCDLSVESSEIDEHVRVSIPPPDRKWLSPHTKRKIIKAQDGCCLYCDRRFGSARWRYSRRIILRIHWDHYCPHAYSMDSRPSNIVAACHICNSIKAARIFDSIEEMRVYIQNKIVAKGYTDVPPVPKELHPETGLAEIL